MGDGKKYFACHLLSILLTTLLSQIHATPALYAYVMDHGVRYISNAMYPKIVHSWYFPWRILICLRFHKLLKQVAAVSDVGRWILFQYLIVFVPPYWNLTPPISTIFSDPLSLYAKHFKAITLLKHWKHFKVSTETSAKRVRERKRKKTVSCWKLFWLC